MYSRTFWMETLERAVKSFAQALTVLLAGGVGLGQVDWPAALGLAGMTGLLSLLTSLASLRVGPPGSASVVTTDAAAAPVVTAPVVPQQRVAV